MLKDYVPVFSGEWKNFPLAFALQIPAKLHPIDGNLRLRMLGKKGPVGVPSAGADRACLTSPHGAVHLGVKGLRCCVALACGFAGLVAACDGSGWRAIWPDERGGRVAQNAFTASVTAALIVD